MDGKKIIALTLAAYFFPALNLHQVGADEPHSEVAQYIPFMTQVVTISMTGAVGWQWSDEGYVAALGDDIGTRRSPEASPANEPVIGTQDLSGNQDPCPGLNLCPHLRHVSTTILPPLSTPTQRESL